MLENSIEQGKLFNREIYEEATQLEIKLLEFKNKLEDKSKLKNTHMTQSLQKYTQFIPSINRDMLNQTLSLDIEIKNQEKEKKEME